MTPYFKEDHNTSLQAERITTKKSSPRVVYLTGGVGGSRFLAGLVEHLRPEGLSVIVNTADDRDFYGLHVSPDLDTTLYKLAGVVSEEGWGIQGDTFFCLEQLGRLGQEAWFRLGDKDLAVHILRTELLHRGLSLTKVTERLTQLFGIPWRILPMSDERVETWIETKEYGWVHFQEYLVKYRSLPTVQGFRYEGIEKARATPAVLKALKEANLVIIGPSNPITSIEPILKLPGIMNALTKRPKAIVAVSPLIEGRPIKGPLDKMLQSLGQKPDNRTLVRRYHPFLKGLVIDEADRNDTREILNESVQILATKTLMRTEEDASRLAKETLDFAQSMAPTKAAKPPS